MILLGERTRARTWDPLIKRQPRVESNQCRSHPWAYSAENGHPSHVLEEVQRDSKGKKAIEIKVADVAELVDARDLKSPGATEITHLSDLTRAGNPH